MRQFPAPRATLQGRAAVLVRAADERLCRHRALSPSNHGSARCQPSGSTGSGRGWRVRPGRQARQLHLIWGAGWPSVPAGIGISQERNGRDEQAGCGDYGRGERDRRGHRPPAGEGRLRDRHCRHEPRGRRGGRQVVVGALLRVRRVGRQGGRCRGGADRERGRARRRARHLSRPDP